MTFLPIVERELRAGAKKAAPRYIRLGVAGVALAFGLFMLVFVPLFSQGRAGGSFAFRITAGYAFALCMAAGIFVTADCLSEEKRGGTLGLLFLTDLRGYDVVLGKLASQLIYLGYGLLAIIPGAALPLLLGGVTGEELWRISLTLLNLLFFSLAAGVFASSLCRQAGKSMVLTAAILAGCCAGLPLLQSLMQSSGVFSASWISWPSPTVPYLLSTESAYARSGQNYWIALGISHLVAWTLIIIASLCLPRSWQERVFRSRQTPPTSSSADTSSASAISSTKPRERDPKLLDHDPVLWLIGRRRGVRAWMWILCALWLGTVVSCSYVMELGQLTVLLWFGWAGALMVKVLFATEACRFFAETRRAGAFELLLATPIEANRFISAQWTSLRKTFVTPMVVAVSGALLVIALTMVTSQDEFQTIFTGIMATGSLVVQVLDILALGWLGMWLALTMKKPQLATGATILYVLILPWLTFCYAWFSGFILDIVLIVVFSSKLRMDFRYTLMNRPELITAAPGSQS